MRVIVYPSIYSNWSYYPETLKLEQIIDIYARVTYKIDKWPVKKQYGTSSMPLQALCIISWAFICELKMELQSGNAQFESKSSIFWPVWYNKLTNDLEKQ